LLEVLIGLMAGAAIGITGVGGGVITAPILVLFLNMPPPESVGTALVFSAAVKVNAMLIYLRRKQIHWRTLSYLLAGGIPGVTVGAFWLERYQRSHSHLILAILGATVTVSAGFGLLRSWNPSAARAEKLHWLPLWSLFIGTEVGFSSAGAGALGTVLLFRLTTLAPAVVVGTDLVFGLALSTFGGGFHVASGSWDRTVLLKLIAGGIVGASAGSHLAGRLPAPVLRRAVLVWALALGLVLLRKGL
jgi:uncharacterized protein